MLKFLGLYLTFLLVLLTACTVEPETVVETVVHEVTVEVEITKLVEVTTEVTREIETTREVPVEITRIVEVERVITVTPSHTPEATPTPEPTNTSLPVKAAPKPTETPPDVSVVLLDTMLTLRGFMQSYGGMIDAALRDSGFNCLDAVNIYDAIATAPTFDVSGSGAEVQGDYGRYRAAIDVFTKGVWDMDNNCREFLENPDNTGSIPPIQWTLARMQIDEAISILSQAIEQP